MNRFWEVLLAVVLVLPVIFMGPVAYAQEDAATVAVTAVVQPHVYLVVDEKDQIIQIFNNSHRESAPIVLAGSLAAQPTALNQSVKNQYELLRPVLDFSKYGVLYQPPSFWHSVMKNAFVQSRMF